MGLMKQSVLRVEQLEERCLLSADVVLHWNQLALDAIRQVKPNPLVASRALAITQAAVYDSVNAIDGSFAPYHAHVHASNGASLEAAAAQAAHDTLAALFPSQATTFDDALAADLVGIPPDPARQGAEVGHDVAQQILTWRSTDGFDAVVPYTPGTDPGDWQPTPPARSPALGPQWPLVTPWAMTSDSQFRPPKPPALDSAEYATALDEVKRLGGDGVTTPTERNAEQTEIALFWKDAAGTSYAFGHWNTIAQGVSTERGLDLVSDARLFALLNIATADAIISCWDAKYEYNFWRPVTAIQTSDPTSNWTPLIVTPNFPSYTSAHSTVSGAASAVLAGLFGPGYHFTAGSEGLAGVTRSFDSFEEAATEAGQSRIYGGIHFRFDSVVGLEVGDNLGSYVLDNYLLPPAKIESVVINDGSAQRSMVNSLTITFDRVVTLDPGAFGLQRNDGREVGLHVAASVVDGRTVAVLTFTGPGIIGGSLADGNYTLTVRGDRIHDAAGRELDGDRDGKAGGNRTDAFFRLYGDSDGDRDVDLGDLRRFLGSFGSRTGDRNYLWYLDQDGNGTVGVLDLLQLAHRFHRR